MANAGKPANASHVKRELNKQADAEKAAFFPKFFKTGKGQYGEGDQFLGVTVPQQRKIAKHFAKLSQDEIAKLLRDEFHECRATGLLILIEQFRQAEQQKQKALVDFYLNNLVGVNNWDLVDMSADKILGSYLLQRKRQLLYKFARDKDLWKQRIAIVATFAFIKQNQFEDTLAISDLLLDHDHDLIHKAVGWMLREVGKRDQARLEDFLKTRYAKMPRTMLRYAIERFDEKLRQSYLSGQIGS